MGSQTCNTFKSMIKLNESILSIFQVMNSYIYCRTNHIFDSAQLKGGTVVVYSLFVVGPIGCGVLCRVPGLMCGSRCPF